MKNKIRDLTITKLILGVLSYLNRRNNFFIVLILFLIVLGIILITHITDEQMVSSYDNFKYHKVWALGALFSTALYTITFHIVGINNKWFNLIETNEALVLIPIDLMFFLLIIIGLQSYEVPLYVVLLSLAFVVTLYVILNFKLALSFRIKSRQLKKEYLKSKQDSISQHEVRIKTNEKFIAYATNNDEIEKAKKENQKLKEKIKRINDCPKTDLRICQSKILNDLSDNFKSSVFSSDIPMLVTLIILTLYTVLLENCSPNSLNSCAGYYAGTDSTTLEFFVYGAIAFQMLFTNAVWIFNDDKFFKKYPLNSKLYKEFNSEKILIKTK